MTGPGPLLLLVAHCREQRRSLRHGLLAEGYRVCEAESGTEAVSQAESYNPDIVLLDLELPDGGGVGVIRRLRTWTRTPIVALAEHAPEPAEHDALAALDAGADDCVRKPCEMRELFARLRVARRRASWVSEKPGEPVIRFGDVRLDVLRREVHRGDRRVHLTPHEFRLVSVLARNAGRPVTYRQLLREVWGPACAQQTQYLRVCMVRLRRKLEPDPSRPRWLVTEVGVGYRMHDGGPPVAP